ncbi:MAG: flippase [Saprospiraceae bacterium]|nr:flippase [Saprospiraceae bacterium]
MSKFSKDTVVYGLGASLKKIIGIFLIPLYTRILTPADYGVVNTMSTFTFLVSVVSSLGIFAALNRYFFLAESEEDKGKVIGTGIILNLFSNGIIALIMLLFAGPISRLLFQTMDYASIVQVCAFIVLVNPLSEKIEIVYRFYRKTRKYLLVTVTKAVITPLITVLYVVIMLKGPWGVKMAALLSTLIVMCFAYFLFPVTKIKWQFSRAWAARMINFGLPLVWTGLAMWIYSVSDRFFLLHYKGLTEVGLYSIGNTFAQPLLIINSAISMSASVIMLGIYEKETDQQKPESKAFTTKIWYYYLIVAVGLALFISIFSTDIFRLLTRPAYYLGALATPLLLFGLILDRSYHLTGQGMNLLEKTKHYAWIGSIAALTNIGLNFFFIPRFGFVGAAITTVISNFTYFIIAYHTSQRFFPVKRKLNLVMVYLITALAISMVCPYSSLLLNYDFSFIKKLGLLLVGLNLPFMMGLVPYRFLSITYVRARDFARNLRKKP